MQQLCTGRDLHTADAAVAGILSQLPCTLHQLYRRYQLSASQHLACAELTCMCACLDTCLCSPYTFKDSLKNPWVDTVVVFHDIGLDRLVNSYRNPAVVDRVVTYVSCPNTRHTMDLDNITSSVVVTAGGSLTFQNLAIQVRLQQHSFFFLHVRTCCMLYGQAVASTLRRLNSGGAGGSRLCTVVAATHVLVVPSVCWCFAGVCVCRAPRVKTRLTGPATFRCCSARTDLLSLAPLCCETAQCVFSTWMTLSCKC